MRKRVRGGDYGNGSGGVGKECQGWTDKITDQWEVGEQRIGENVSDDQSVDGRGDYASCGVRRGGCGQGGSGGGGGVLQRAVEKEERGGTRGVDEQAGPPHREAHGLTG